MKRIALVLMLVLFTVNSYATNYALEFDGSNDYVSIPDSDDWDICGSTTDDKTIGLWVKHNNATRLDYDVYIGQYQEYTNMWYYVRRFPDMIQFHFEGSSGGLVSFSSAPGVSILDTEWHHLALCKAGSDWRIYLDGIQIAYTSDADTQTVAGELTIGASFWAGFMDGQIDEVGIWNYAMTEEQLQYWMHYSPVGPTPGLTAYWDFNEGTGGTVYDVSGNGHHGSLNGPQWVVSGSPVTSIPEPSTILLFGFSLVGAGILRKRRKI